MNSNEKKALNQEQVLKPEVSQEVAVDSREALKQEGVRIASKMNGLERRLVDIINKQGQLHASQDADPLDAKLGGALSEEEKKIRGEVERKKQLFNQTRDSFSSQDDKSAFLSAYHKEYKSEIHNVENYK